MKSDVVSFISHQLRTSVAGLGLYIVKGFMHLQHGDITAESIEGNGSTFIISLPKKITRDNESLRR